MSRTVRSFHNNQERHSSARETISPQSVKKESESIRFLETRPLPPQDGSGGDCSLSCLHVHLMFFNVQTREGNSSVTPSHAPTSRFRCAGRARGRRGEHLTHDMLEDVHADPIEPLVPDNDVAVRDGAVRPSRTMLKRTATFTHVSEFSSTAIHS